MKNINNHNKDSLWKRIIKLMDEIIFDIQQTDILQLILFRINTLLPVYSEDFKIVVCLNDKSDNESNSIYNKMKNCPIICDCEKIIFFRTILSLFDNYSKKITEKKYKALTLFDEKCKCTLIYNPPESENLFLYDWGMERKRARIKQLMEFNKNIIVSSLAIIRVKYVLHGPDYISQSNELTDKRIDCYHDCIKSNKFVVLFNTDSNDINSANNLINDISRCL